MRLRVLQRALEQQPADAAAAERRLDRQGPEQQCRRVADADRQLPDGSDQQRTDAGGEGQIEQMIHVLADAVRAEHEAAGPEGAFVQPLDRVSIAGGFRQDGE